MHISFENQGCICEMVISRGDSSHYIIIQDKPIFSAIFSKINPHGYHFWSIENFFLLF